MQIAQAMVRRFGMSERIGPLTYTRGEMSAALSAFAPSSGGVPFSEQTGQLIDAEIRTLIDGQHRRTREILSAHRSELDRVAEELMAKESITGARLRELIGPEQAAEPSGVTRCALPSASLAS